MNRYRGILPPEQCPVCGRGWRYLRGELERLGHLILHSLTERTP
jgi:hypothetical protein